MPRTHLHAFLLVGGLAVALACGGGDGSDPAVSTGTDDDGSGGGSSLSSADADADDDGTSPETTSGVSADEGMDDAGDDESGPPPGDSSDGEIPVHACCSTDAGPGCAADLAVEACVCATEEGASCCTDAWDDHCVAIMEHYECAAEAAPCGGPVEAVPWDCNCTTTNVTCIDNPFVSQVTFFEDACSGTHVEALAHADAYCVSGDDDCMGAPGSCDCTCELDDPRPPNACAE